MHYVKEMGMKVWIVHLRMLSETAHDTPVLEVCPVLGFEAVIVLFSIALDGCRLCSAMISRGVSFWFLPPL